MSAIGTIMSTTYLTPNWPAPKTVNAYTTMRFHEKGHSRPPYDNFNLATHVDDELSRVSANEQLLINDLQLPQAPLWLNQVHGSQCVMATDVNTGTQADAIVGNKPNQVCVIMTADCLPILLCSESGNEIAAIHGGWRSLNEGIITKTLEKMHTPPQQLMAWLGPCICQDCYQVDVGFYSKFTDKSQNFDSCFYPKADKYHASLQKIAAVELESNQVNRLYIDNSCTFCEHKRFFSYRREQQTGRIATLIWTSSEPKVVL